MNSKELINQLDNAEDWWELPEYQNWSFSAVDMLRQQADRITELEAENQRLKEIISRVTAGGGGGTSNRIDVYHHTVTTTGAIGGGGAIIKASKGENE